MPKRNTRRNSRKRRGGNPIAAATRNFQSATNARVEKTKQQVTHAVVTAKNQAQHAVQKAKTTAENTVATQINNAAAAVRPKPPPPTALAKSVAVNLLAPVHHAIKHGARAVRKVVAGTPNVSAHHVAVATKQAHAAADGELKRQALLQAAQKQQRALVAAQSTTPPTGLVTSPMVGGRKKRRTRGLIGKVAYLGADFTGDVARGTGALVQNVPVVGEYGKNVVDFTGRAGSDIFNFAGRTGDEAVDLAVLPFKNLLGKSRKSPHHKTKKKKNRRGGKRKSRKGGGRRSRRTRRSSRRSRRTRRSSRRSRRSRRNRRR